MTGKATLGARVGSVYYQTCERRRSGSGGRQPVNISSQTAPTPTTAAAPAPTAAPTAPTAAAPTPTAANVITIYGGAPEFCFCWTETQS